MPRATRKLGGLVRGLNPDAKVNDRSAPPETRIQKYLFYFLGEGLYMSHCNEFGLRIIRQSMVLFSPSRMLGILESCSTEKLLAIVEVWSGLDLARHVRAMYRRRIAQTEQSPLEQRPVITWTFSSTGRIHQGVWTLKQCLINHYVSI